jgi:hypothetical protein
MSGLRLALFAALFIPGLLETGDLHRDHRVQARFDDALRRESDALVEMADDAVRGRAVPTDFVLEWRNDFFKAQPGTFVPFTISFTAPPGVSDRALLYIRVESRSISARAARTFAYETIFPIRIDRGAGERLSVTRGFAVPAGRYRAVLALRELADGGSSDPPRKAGVLLQDLTVPDFWTGELATSTIMLANDVERLDRPVPTDELDEDPYVVGSSRIHVTRDRTFARNRELIVAFLIYNPSFAPDKNFDLQVDYHLYRKEAREKGDQAIAANPPARSGERYVTRTTPQRFNPSMMGPQYDPSAGTPLLAGQGILLSGFEPGEYRLGITVTDLLSRKTLTRDVIFTVAGS